MMDNNPYASPKAGSPNVNRSMTPQNEAGNLKLSIALGQKGPTIIHKGPFYLVVKQDEKDFEPPEGTVTGATNLMASKNLEHSYGKLTTKKLKDTLSSFLPQLPGAIDAPGNQDNSSLRGLIEKPPSKDNNKMYWIFIKMILFILLYSLWQRITSVDSPAIVRVQVAPRTFA